MSKIGSLFIQNPGPQNGTLIQGENNDTLNLLHALHIFRINP